MAAKMTIDLTKIGQDEALVDHMDKESKGFKKAHAALAAGAATLSATVMRTMYRTGLVKKSTLRNLVTDYVEAEKVIWTLHGGNHTDICLGLEGKVWNAESAHPVPPVHWNCKSTLEPHYPSGNSLSGVFNG